MLGTLTLSKAYFVLTTATEAGGASAGGWFIPTAFTVLAGCIFWFMRDKFGGLGETDKRIEGNLDKNFTFLLKETKSIDGRVGRIEGHLKIGLFGAHSPITLSELGRKILNESGVKDAADKYRDMLLEKIQAQNPRGAYDVQEATRLIFQAFDFGDEFLNRFKEYCFNEGQWELSDLEEVGAIYFRDIALKELGFDIMDLNGEEDAAPGQDETPDETPEDTRA